MKKTLTFILALTIILSVSAAAFADGSTPKTSWEYYTIGAVENTFSALYKIMCVDLDVKNYPIPEPVSKGSYYSTGDYEKISFLKNDWESIEYIGYVYDYYDKPIYIVRCWAGIHEEGELIGMIVYYTVDGKYIGNIQRDYTNGLSNSSSRVPYCIPSQGTHKLK